MGKIAVIIVTHNSEPVIGRCLDGLQGQEELLEVIMVVDSGSNTPGYLDAYAGRPKVKVLKTDNIGFSRANNLGYRNCASGCESVVFLNPDTFLKEDIIHKATALLDGDRKIGCITGKLQGYDSQANKATGLLDSTGIKRSWYGRWFDRGQGKQDLGQFDRAQQVEAACGAFMVCRNSALQEAALAGRDIFDPDFFMYKEDIELCLRLRSKGWKVIYHPELEAYHCRGWHKSRKEVPYSLRLAAARSEVLLYRKHPSVYMLWAVCKYLLVRVLRL